MSNIFENLEVKKVKKINDGVYMGEITDIDRDTSSYDYTKYTISFNIDDEQNSLTVSYPTNVTYMEDGQPSSQHAVFLDKMGYKIGDNVGEFISGLKNKKVQILVMNNEKLVDGKKKTYSEIVKDSVKPI